jgi:hypothetical protein
MRGSSVSAILSAVYVGWSIAPYPGAQPGPLLLWQPPTLGQLAMVVPVLTTAATAGAGAPILPALAATTAVTHLDSRAIAVARVLQRRQTASAITSQSVTTIYRQYSVPPAVPAAVCTSLTGAHSRPHTARRSGPGRSHRVCLSAPAVVAPALMHGIGRACPVVTAGWISHRSSPPGAASPGVSGCRTPATTGADGRAAGDRPSSPAQPATGAHPRAARRQPGADGRAVPHRPSGPISPKIIKELHLKRCCTPHGQSHFCTEKHE